MPESANYYFGHVTDPQELYTTAEKMLAYFSIELSFRTLNFPAEFKSPNIN